MSTAILTLSENGELQRIHDKWLTSASCSSQDSSGSDANQLNLVSFWGLFLICGLACAISLFVFFMRIFCQYMKYIPPEEGESSVSDEAGSGRLTTLRSFKGLISFYDKKEEEVKNALKRKASEKQQQTGQSSDGSYMSPA